jgi:hypothetical protein
MIFGFYYYAYAEPIEEALLEPTKISWLCAECDDGDENKK